MDIDQARRLRVLMEEQSGFVERTLRKAGVREADLDDEVQRTFIAAASRLEDVRPSAERSFLFQVAIYRALHARRQLARRREVLGDSAPESVEALGTPEDLAERKQLRKMLDDIIESMPPREGLAFTLYQIEEMNMTEIAAILRVPRGTVASRLRRARARFDEQVAGIRRAWNLGRDPRMPFRKPTRLQRNKQGALERALLAAGATVPASPRTHAKTLAACLAALA